jgi:competence ComEA-like helix-hairpin-helix protein
MSQTVSSQKVKEWEKDDRLIILLGIGILLLFFHCFHNVFPLFPASHNTLKLRWNGANLIVEETDPLLLSEEKNDKDRDALIPAVFSPIFFAPLPINEANQTLLETLPGIGPSLAFEIIKTRSEKGPFCNPEDLLNIRGIGRKRMLKFADQFSYR